MLFLKGETRAEYFHVECDACGHYVILSNLRWVGGVPQIKATCKECNESGDFKLHPPTWFAIVSGEG